VVDDDLYFQSHFSSRSNPIVGVSFSWVGAAVNAVHQGMGSKTGANLPSGKKRKLDRCEMLFATQPAICKDWGQKIVLFFEPVMEGLLNVLFSEFEHQWRVVFVGDIIYILPFCWVM